jgi:hypothetical protein
MERYSWPQGPASSDDPATRGRYNDRFLPAPNVPAPAGAPPPPAREPAPAHAPLANAKAAGVDGRHLWVPLGPTTVINGQASGRPRVAGRIKTIAVEPATGDRVYAATASGGVWVSLNRGISWRPLDEFHVSPGRGAAFPMGNCLACGALHVAFGAAADGSGDVVTVGTGEPGGSDGTPGGNLAGIGVLRATGPAAGTPWSLEGDPAFRGQAFFRIVADPGDPNRLVAATTAGLFLREAATGWVRLTGMTPGTYTDVVLLRLTGPDRLRIFVTVHAGLFVADVAGPPTPIPPGGPVFQPVALPNVATFVAATATARALGATRTALALDPGGNLFVLGRRTPLGTATFRSAHLWRVNANAALAAVTATEISGTPADLFGNPNDQSDYDMCIATHPTRAGLLYVGGSTVWIDNAWNASLYQLQVAGTAATPTLVGRGVHADVHALTVGPVTTGTQRQFWVGCDGGVFYSPNDGGADTFVQRNNDLAVLQPGFVANHPTNEGLVAAGMQDNGTCERIGDTLWSEPLPGDGGGLVYDPTGEPRFYAQYTKATWQSSDGRGRPPVLRRGATAPTGQKTSEQIEDDASLFYSGCDALAHAGGTHLVLGSDRIWYSRDWGQTWVTLPTGEDPRAGRNPSLTQDVISPATPSGTFTDNTTTSGGCCAHTDTGSSVAGNGVLVCRLSARSDAGGQKRMRVLALVSDKLGIIAGTRAADSTGPFTFTWAATEAIRAPLGATEIAAVDDAAPLTFLPVPGLVNDVGVHDPERGARGSAYICSVGGPGSGPGHELDTLWWYDGDGHFVPCGMRRVHTRGVWSGDRIAAPALSVAVDPDDRSQVYIGTSVGVVHGSLTMVDSGGTLEPRWAFTEMNNGLPEGAVHDLAIFRHDGVKLLRAALQARGVWETDLANIVAQPRTYLRVHRTDTRRRRPTLLDGPTTRGSTGLRWDASPDLVFDRTGLLFPSPGPSEADLFQHVQPAEVGEHAAEHFEAASFKVHVLVHHRWFEAARPAQVLVVLLRHEMVEGSDAVPLNGLWAVLRAIPPGGPMAGALPAGWVQAGGTLLASPGAEVETRLPRAVTFNVNVGGVLSGTRLCFLAVVISQTDPLTEAEIRMGSGLDANTVEDLVLYSPHCAARTLRRG